MSLNSLFNRTVKTNIIIYPTDGCGRDGYITHNNAGFWKENIKQIVPKETFNRPPFGIYHSLKSTPPIWTYYSDGSGRDSYVYYNNGGLKRKFSPLARQTLQKFLRGKEIDSYSPNSHQRIHLSKEEKIYLNKINQIQRNLVNRLYNQYKYKYKFLNKDSTNGYRYGNTMNNNNNLYRSSSQIFGRQTLEPIKYNFNYSNNTLNRNSSTNNLNSSNNNLLWPKNNESFKLKSLRTRNKNSWRFKRELISNNIDNQILKNSKIKCSLDDNNKKNYN